MAAASERKRQTYIHTSASMHICGVWERDIKIQRDIYLCIYKGREREREEYRMEGHSRLKERERVKSLTRDPNAQIKDIQIIYIYK